jgi:hypothetical protein
MPIAAPIVAAFGGGAAGTAAAGGAAAGLGAGADAIGNGIRDFSRVGRNNYQATPWGITPQYDENGNLTGYQGLSGAKNEVTPQMAGAALYANDKAQAASQGGMDYATGQMKGAQSRGPQATEDQYLSDQEAMARNGDEMGAMQLMRERAMGQAPSEAAYMMQQGLDRGLANQQAIAGSARGAAGLAQAQGNMAGNAANMEQGAFTAAGQLRAKEMADATNAYGNLAGQVRQQDQSRMGQADQVSQFNAGLNDQYALGMGSLGVQYGNLGVGQAGIDQGYWKTGADIGDANANRDMQAQQLNSQNWNEAQGINAGVAQGNSDKERENRDMWIELAGKGVGMGGSIAGAGKG